MQVTSRSRVISGALLVLLWLAITLNFQTNALGIAEPAIFERWQLNGQARVLGGMLAVRHGLETDGAHMGKVYRLAQTPDPLDEEATAAETYRVFADFPGADQVGFVPYKAQFGLQAVAYGALAESLGLTRLAQIQIVPAALTALVIVALFAAYRRLYDRLFAVLFLLCLIGAPYMIAMARNLYWSPFLLFLPALLAAGLYGEARRMWRGFWLAAIAVAMMFKSLSNYEYITTVTLLACSVFLVAPLFHDRRPDLKTAVWVFLACVLGFFGALLIHAGMRGDSLLAGLRAIYLEDIARRTYGDPGLFGAGEVQDSLRASPLDVLRIYLFDYPGRRTMIVPGKVFLGLIVLSLLGIVLKGVFRHRHFRRDLMMFVVFFSVPVSWFVFAKGHSFTQTHINFVLWYIGFMPALLYLGISTLRALPEMVAGTRRRP